MIIYDGGIMRNGGGIAIGEDCCCGCCPGTIPLVPGTFVGEGLVVLCIDPVTEETCTCTWEWNGTEWVLLSDSCNP